MNCTSLNFSEKSADQIAAERALLNRKTALLERENQVLRSENLELTRAQELQKAEFEKRRVQITAEHDKRATELKTAEENLANLTEKLKILESESGGKIKQLTILHEQFAQKSTETQRRLQEELSEAQLAAARDKEKLTREATEKQFAQSKELQEFRQRLSEKEKEVEELRRKLGEMRENELKSPRKNPATP